MSLTTRVSAGVGVVTTCCLERPRGATLDSQQGTKTEEKLQLSRLTETESELVLMVKDRRQKLHCIRQTKHQEEIGRHWQTNLYIFGK